MEVLPYNKILTKLKRRIKTEALTYLNTYDHFKKDINFKKYFYTIWLWAFFKEEMIQRDKTILNLQEFYGKFILLESNFLGDSWNIKNLNLKFVPNYDKKIIEIITNNPLIVPRMIRPLSFALYEDVIDILSIYIKNYNQITKAIYECADKTILNCAKLVKLRRLKELRQEARNE